MSWKWPPPIFSAADVDYGVVRMELAVRAFERFRDAHHRFDDIEAAEQIDVDAGGVADEAQNRVILPHGNVHVQIAALEPFDEVVDFFLRIPRVSTLLPYYCTYYFIITGSCKANPRMSLCFPLGRLLLRFCMDGLCFTGG